MAKKELSLSRVKDGWQRKTYIVRIEIAERLQVIAKRRKRPLKDILDILLTGALDDIAKKIRKKRGNTGKGTTFDRNLYGYVNHVDYFIFKEKVRRQGKSVNQVLRGLLEEWERRTTDDDDSKNKNKNE